MADVSISEWLLPHPKINQLKTNSNEEYGVKNLEFINLILSA